MNNHHRNITVAERLTDYFRLMRLDRPIGSLLLLWPTLWALWVAGDGRPDAYVVLVFVVGVFVMRSAGCIINDYADRNLDPLVERTRDRPLAAGRISGTGALTLFISLLLLALVLVLTLNTLTLLYSLVGLGLALSYPYFKRFTQLPQAWLGIAFAWGIPMAFAALQNRVPLEAWLLLLANLCWVMAYDTLYAMVDRDDDIRIGIRSTAILAGRYDLKMVAISHLFFLVLLLLLGLWLQLSVYYYLCLLLAAGIAVYQQILCRKREREACFSAFLNNSWMGAVVFLGLLLAYLP